MNEKVKEIVIAFEGGYILNKERVSVTKNELRINNTIIAKREGDFIYIANTNNSPGRTAILNGLLEILCCQDYFEEEITIFRDDRGSCLKNDNDRTISELPLNKFVQIAQYK